jgi:RNA polymerase sigma-70 factor (ECF subfamily)
MASSRTASFESAGQEAWPEIVVDPAAFARFLEERAAAEPRHAADLYLAFACAGGNPTALTAFDRRYLADVETYLGGVNPSPELIDEVRQALREQLFLGERPRITDYSGRGSLASWVRVAALRFASNVRRAAGTRKRLEGHSEEPAALPVDPELALIRRRYSAQFERSLADSFALLDERDRNLLRLHLLDGLGIDELAPVFRVHRATVARWLQAARAQLKERVLELLRTNLRVSEMELASLARAIESHLEISLRAFFRSGPAPENGP